MSTVTRTCALAALTLLSYGALANPGDTELVSVKFTPATIGYGFATGGISREGRHVLFMSDSPTFVAGDTNGTSDVFLSDRLSGTTTRVSVGAGGVQGNGYSGWNIALSANGRYVVFESSASNLVPGDTNGEPDIFLRDVQGGTTERVNLDSSGRPLPASSYPSVTPDGRYVVFRSGSVMVRDRLTRQTTTVPSGGTEGAPVISDDARYVALSSWGRVFLVDRTTGRRELISRTYTGERVNANAYPASISADNRYVLYTTEAFNVVPNDTNGREDGFVYDRQLKTTARVTVADDGSQLMFGQAARMSADGRFVAFETLRRFVGGIPAYDIMVRDRALRTSRVVSVNSAGTLANAGSHGPFPSGNGQFVAFYSNATNLAPADTEIYSDAYVHELEVAAGSPLSLSPTRLAFGGVVVNTTSPRKTVTVTNKGSSAISITSIRLAGADPLQFVRLRQCPAVLPAGDTCNVLVSFAPTSPGAKSARLTVSIGIAGQSRSVALSGTGL